jgi:hypothetical protein
VTATIVADAFARPENLLPADGSEQPVLHDSAMYTENFLLLARPTGLLDEPLRAAVEAQALALDGLCSRIDAASKEVTRTLRPEAVKPVRESLARAALAALESVTRSYRPQVVEERLAADREKFLNPVALLRYPEGDEFGREERAQMERETRDILRGMDPLSRSHALREAARKGDLVTLRAAFFAPPVAPLLSAEEQGELAAGALDVLRPTVAESLRDRSLVAATFRFNQTSAEEALHKLLGLARDPVVSNPGAA